MSEPGVSAATDQTPEVPTNRFDCFETSAQILREGTARRESSQDPSVIKGAQRGIGSMAAAARLQVRLRRSRPSRRSVTLRRRRFGPAAADAGHEKATFTSGVCLSDADVHTHTHTHVRFHCAFTDA